MVGASLQLVDFQKIVRISSLISLENLTLKQVAGLHYLGENSLGSIGS